MKYHNKYGLTVHHKLPFTVQGSFFEEHETNSEASADRYHPLVALFWRLAQCSHTHAHAHIHTEKHTHTHTDSSNELCLFLLCACLVGFRGLCACLVGCKGLCACLVGFRGFRGLCACVVGFRVWTIDVRQ